jgi:hypothetical protein
VAASSLAPWQLEPIADTDCLVKAPKLELTAILVVAFGGWTFVGLFSLAQFVTRGGTVTLPEAIAVFESVWLWALFSPLIVEITRRLLQGREQRRRSLLAHTLFALLFTVADAAIDTPVLAAIGLRASFRGLWVGELHINVFSYVGVAVAGYAAMQYRAAAELRSRALQLERRFLAARLDALSARLRPHFFFNALNSIASLVRLKERDEALAAIGNLGDLLRETLAVGSSQAVPLARELGWVERYLQVEKMRFADRLSFVIDAHESCDGALVPALLLHPLVDNAIRHGVERRLGASTVRVEAQRRNGELHLAVLETGVTPHVDPDEAGAGLGLQATRERLEHLFGSGHFCLTLDATAADSAARVVIPFQEES